MKLFSRSFISKEFLALLLLIGVISAGCVSIYVKSVDNARTLEQATNGFIRKAVYMFQDEFGRQGSGVLIAPNQLLTAAHVVAEGGMFVIFPDGSKKPVRVLAMDTDQDIAVVEVLGMACPCTPLAEAQAKTDEPVRAVGFPMNHTVGAQLLTEGRVQGILKLLEPLREYLVATTQLAPGNSGGGLFDKHGKLQGIASAVPNVYGQMVLHIGLFVGVDQIKAFLTKNGI